jgi:hypothetical protein
MEYAPLRVQWNGDHIRFNDPEDIPEEPDMGYMGLNERLVSGLEERAMEEGGDKKGPFFRELIYNSQEYRDAMGSTKMGTRQCNWRDASGEFISPIFGIMWRTYAKLLKRDQALRQRRRTIEISETTRDIEISIDDITSSLAQLRVQISRAETPSVQSVPRVSQIPGVSYHRETQGWVFTPPGGRMKWFSGRSRAEEFARMMS